MNMRLGLVLTFIVCLALLIVSPISKRVHREALAEPPDCNCPVQPLSQDFRNDPDSLRFENGDRVDLSHLTSDMQTAVDCLGVAITGAGGTLYIDSAFRPGPYQSHMQEIWDKHKQLNRLKGAARRQACASVKQAVDAEFAAHMLTESQRPAGPNGPHTQGQAIDIGLDRMGLTRQTVLNIAADCQLYRPYLPSDPTHFQHR